METKKQEHPITLLVNRGKSSIVEALAGSPVTFDKFVVGLKDAAGKNPDLARCIQTNPQSVLHELVKAAQLGLSPSPVKQHFHLIPRNLKQNDGSKILTCTSIVGYRGLIDLAMRSGQLEDIGAELVYQGEQFDIDRTTGEILHQRDDPFVEFDESKVRGGYAWAKVQGRTRLVVRVLSIGEILKRKAVAGTSTFWTKWPREQMEKTLLRSLLNSGRVPLGELGDRLAEVDAAEEEIRVAAYSEPEPTPDAHETLPGWLGDEPGAQEAPQDTPAPECPTQGNLGLPEGPRPDAEERKKKFYDQMAIPMPLGVKGLCEAIQLMDDPDMLNDEGFQEHIGMLTDKDREKVRKAAKVRVTEIVGGK